MKFHIIKTFSWFVLVQVCIHMYYDEDTFFTLEYKLSVFRVKVAVRVRPFNQR